MHQPTLRVLRVLELVNESGSGKRLSDFSRELQYPKSTLLPILQTLCDNRYLNLDEAGRYTAGTALFSLGAAFSGCFPVLDYVQTQLAAMVSEFGETCYCGTLEDGCVLYLDKVDSPQPLRMLTNPGRRLPAYATSLGKALLIGRTEQQLRELYPNGLEKLTEHTITEFSVLAEQLRQAEKNGYAWESEESTEYIKCFAAPIRKNGAIVAAISVAIPLFRYYEADEERIISTLKRYAAQMSGTFERTNAHFGGAF